MANSVQVIQPDFNGNAQAEAEFWANVDDDPEMVVLALVLTAGDEEAHVFSTYGNAVRYGREVDALGVVIVPKRIDEPLWGNGAVN